MKVLIVAAMLKEVEYLIKEYSMVQNESLQSGFHVYSTKIKEIDINLIITFVGDTSAAIATTLALQKFDSDFVIKIGCVGGTSKDTFKGDIIIAEGFFHSGSWITRSYIDNSTTSNASLWESVFGDKPYQVNLGNLGNIPYFVKPDKVLNKNLVNLLDKKKIKYKNAHVGGGNMWFFDKTVMDHIANNILPKDSTLRRWVADMESYAVVKTCQIFNKPFTGLYVIASSDYKDEEYDPNIIDDIMKGYVLNIFSEFIETFKF